MKAWGVLLALGVAAPALAGCMGPPAAEAAPKPRYAPYENVFVVPLSGPENREPECAEDGACSEYYLVRVRGSENATLMSGRESRLSCTKPWLYDAYPSNQTLVFNASKYPSLGSAGNYSIVAEEFWGVAFSGSRPIRGCPTVYGLGGYAKTDPPAHKRILGAYGLFTLNMYRENGSLAFRHEDQFKLFQIGQKLIVSYGEFRAVGDATFYVEGGFEIANLGPWPVSGLQPGRGFIRGPG